MSVLSAPWFNDPDAARDHLEFIRWPNGPVCPHCGNTDGDRIKRVEGKSHRAGLYACRECNGHFTVTVGTLFERSHIPLHQWFKAVYFLCSSKKGMSAHQLHRTLGVTYKSAWFMAHRIREAMREGKFPGPLGGANKAVEADETYVGGKAKNRAYRKPRAKEKVFSLVERDGKVRSFHVPHVNAKTLKPIIRKHVDKKSRLETDEAPVYGKVGKEFAGHGVVNHSISEYVRGYFDHTNTVENYFSILKRGLVGTYQHVSPTHLKRYVGEFDFRYNNRKISDSERMVEALKGIEGKRLTYGGPRSPEAKAS